MRLTSQSPSRPVPLPALRQALEDFGGTQFTNLCVAPAGAADQELDLTISFPRFAALADNTLLVPDYLNGEISDGYVAIAQALGASVKRKGQTLTLSRRQLRSGMSADAQLRAVELARELGLDATLYSATIPAAQSVRIEERHPASDDEPVHPSGDRDAYRKGAGAKQGALEAIDVFVGRGLTAETNCSERDAVDIEQFFREGFGVGFGGRQWSLVALLGDPNPPPPPREKRRGIKFTLFFKGR